MSGQSGRIRRGVMSLFGPGPQLRRAGGESGVGCCRFETEGGVNPDGSTKRGIRQDIRSLVLCECQYQFTLGRSAKNAEEETADESGAPPPVFLLLLRSIIIISLLSLLTNLESLNFWV